MEFVKKFSAVANIFGSAVKDRRRPLENGFLRSRDALERAKKNNLLTARQVTTVIKAVNRLLQR